MSADNWSYCPRCMASREVEKKRLREEVQEAYGKVPIADFDYLRQKADRMEELKSTLREDYELWIDDNLEFHIRYHCSCEVCGFGYSFKHDTKVSTG